MKSNVLQEDFYKSLTNASRFVSSRIQLPVLGNILLKTAKTKMTIISTNLETSISISIGAQIKEEGEITVPAKVITEIVANLLPGSISLSSEKEQLTIQTQGSVLKIGGMNSSDFPSVPERMETKVTHRFTKDDLQEALTQVMFAASIDETRPVLTGILFLFKKDALVLVATDGFRLSQKKIPFKGGTKTAKLILPKSALVEVLRLLGEEEEVLFGHKENENQAIFSFTDMVLSSRVLEGEFPDFEKIMPKDLPLKVEVDKEDFLRATKLASVFARDSANIVKVLVKKGSVRIFAESSQAGSQETEIEAKVDGEGFEIAFNYRFLEEFLHSVAGGTVKIELSSPNFPAVFTDPKDSTFLHLIMPVRIQG